MTEMYSDHFSVKELQCPTSFKIKLAFGFIGDLEELRVAYAHGMEVTDGCRDESYNEWLISRGYPASENSFHLIKNGKYMTDGGVSPNSGGAGGGGGNGGAGVVTIDQVTK